VVSAMDPHGRESLFSRPGVATSFYSSSSSIDLTRLTRLSGPPYVHNTNFNIISHLPSSWDSTVGIVTKLKVAGQRTMVLLRVEAKDLAVPQKINATPPAHPPFY
jgi:hypothetical protein